MEKEKLDALGHPPTDILLSPIGKPLEISMRTADEELHNIHAQNTTNPDEDRTTWPNGNSSSVVTRPIKTPPTDASYTIDLQQTNSLMRVDNVDNMNNITQNCICSNIEKVNSTYSLTLKENSAIANEIKNVENSSIKSSTGQNGQKLDKIEKKENVIPNEKVLSRRKLHNVIFDKLDDANLRRQSRQTEEKIRKTFSIESKRNMSDMSDLSRTSESVRYNSLRSETTHTTRKISSANVARSLKTSTTISSVANGNEKTNNKNLVGIPRNELKQFTKGRGRIVRITTGTSEKTAILKETPQSDERKKNY